MWRPCAMPSDNPSIAKRRLTARRWTIVVSALTIGLLGVVAGCDQPPAVRNNKDAQLQPVATTQPKLKPLQVGRPLINRPHVPSKGDCAPKYPNGLIGSCINDKPCRGFGELLDDGRVLCLCYASPECREGYRCDAMVKHCVPEATPSLARSPSR